MAFFSPAQNGFEPKRKFRFLVDFSHFSGETSIMATKCSKPSYELTAVTEHRVLNHTFKFPGIVKWNDIDVSFIDSMEPNMATKFWNSLGNSGFVEPKTANALVTGITKIGGYLALGVVTIKQLNGGGVFPPEGIGDQEPNLTADETRYSDMWTLHNAFIKSVKFGDLDYSSDDLVNIDVGIAYDYAVYSGYANGAPLNTI
jgi:hypothetical protein